MAKSKQDTTKKILELVAEGAEARQAIDLKILDVRKTSKMVDYLVICSADSTPQIRAIEKEIDSRLRKHKVKGFRWQGQVKSGWLVLDLGAIAIHIMGAEERAYYDLEGLWGKEAVVFHY